MSTELHYTLNGKEITREAALKELNDRPVSTEAKWVGNTLVMRTLKIKLDDVSVSDRRAERKCGIL
jgi:hypothetical protein